MGVVFLAVHDINMYHFLCCTLAVGRLCELMETATSERSRQSCSEIGPYVTTLVPSASCNSGQPGTLVWTPDESTPDVVYYQVGWFAHMNTWSSYKL